MTKRGRRHNHTGSITRLPSGRYRGYVQVGYKPDGSPDRRYHSARTSDEVQAWITQSLRDQVEGLLVGRKSQPTSRFLLDWLEDTSRPSVSAGSYEGYESVVRVHLIPRVGHVPLDRLTPQHVTRMMADMARDGVPTPRIRYARTVLGIALSQAVRWRWLPHNVVTFTDPPRVTKPRIDPLTPEQAQLFLAGIKGHRLEALYVTAILLGLRRGELIALRWQDIDFERSDLTVAGSTQRLKGGLQRTEPKTARSYRTIRMPRSVRTSLQEHRKRQLARSTPDREWRGNGEGLVFISSVGTAIEPKNVLRDFKKLLEGLELPRHRFHDLRHTFASIALQQGVPIHVVSNILGHASIRITIDTYGHIYDQSRQAAADMIDLAFGIG